MVQDKVSGNDHVLIVIGTQVVVVVVVVVGL